MGLCILNKIYETELGTLYHGDAVDLMSVVERESIELIITDPPYAKQYKPLYRLLNDLSIQILKEHGSLFTIIQHYCVPEVLGYFTEPLKWRWLLQLMCEKLHRRWIACDIDEKACTTTIKRIERYKKDGML